MVEHTDILKFWFETLSARDWWRKNEELDAQIRNDFLDIHQNVAQGNTLSWRETDAGRLAEIIVLDQLSRNMFRGQPGSFAYDAQALELTRAAVEAGTQTRMDETRAGFLLMPFMHSESLSDHQEGLPLFKAHCSAGTFDFEQRHMAIIQKFGRYPHRNKILGRELTAEEEVFLNEPGSSF